MDLELAAKLDLASAARFSLGLDDRFWVGGAATGRGEGVQSFAEGTDAMVV